MTEQEKLIDYIKNLTEEQAEKLVEHLPLLKQLIAMKDYELIYSETLLAKLFNRTGETA